MERNFVEKILEAGRLNIDSAVGFNVCLVHAATRRKILFGLFTRRRKGAAEDVMTQVALTHRPRRVTQG